LCLVLNSLILFLAVVFSAVTLSDISELGPQNINLSDQILVIFYMSFPVVVAGLVVKLAQNTIKQVGSYRLIQRIGGGAMGEVWEADHLMLARKAAIKFVRGDIPDSPKRGIQEPSLNRRFEREARTMAELRSPHTIEIFDFGTTDQGVFYYAMELLEGITLQDLVTRFGPQPSERVIPIMIQICHSLGEAHERGVIHRDIKPANIFLCRYGRDTDFVKVLDFGMVKRHEILDEEQLEMTAMGTYIGTPAFSSPEQASCGTEVVDERSDIYSLGCVAFWLLTGSIVFDTEGVQQMLRAHRELKPRTPSSLAPTPVPAELDNLILACLAENSQKRPISVDQISSQLHQICCSQLWTPERSREWWHVYLPSSPAHTVSAKSLELADTQVRTTHIETLPTVRD